MTAELFLPALTAYSLQGDSVITEIMANFGITSQFKDGGVYLQKEAKPILRKIFDFKEWPGSGTNRNCSLRGFGPRCYLYRIGNFKDQRNRPYCCTAKRTGQNRRLS